MALFPPLDKRNTCDKAKACVSLWRGISGRSFGDEERGRRGVVADGRLREGDCVPLGEETTYIYI